MEATPLRVESEPRRSPDFETTVRAYWKMAYWHALRESRGRHADAEDLTQAFFCHLLEKNLLAHFAPERGSLGTFIILCFKGFLRDQRNRELAGKRGGGRRFISLERGCRAGGEEEAVSPAGGKPEDLVQRGIERVLVQRAVSALREIYRSEGRERYYRVFEAYDWNPGPRTSYARVAGECGITPEEVTRYLFHARRRLRDLVRRLVGEPAVPS